MNGGNEIYLMIFLMDGNNKELTIIHSLKTNKWKQ